MRCVLFEWVLSLLSSLMFLIVQSFTKVQISLIFLRLVPLIYLGANLLIHETSITLNFYEKILKNSKQWKKGSRFGKLQNSLDTTFWIPPTAGLWFNLLIFRSRYSRMDQAKFVEGSLWKILSDVVCLSSVPKS